MSHDLEIVMVRMVVTVAVLCLVGAAAAGSASPPARPPLLKTFSAKMTGYSFAPGTG